MHTPESLTGLVNLVATGSSLLLLHRGPSPRLRRLILAAGIMTMAQLSVIVYSSIGGFSMIGGTFRLLVGLAAIYALRLLYEETHERHLAGSPVEAAAKPEPGAPAEPVEPSRWLQASAKQRIRTALNNGDPIVIEKTQQPAVEPCTTGLLALVQAIGTSDQPIAEREPVCVTKRQSPWPLC
ncbi:MAG: hypothetical protein HY820_45990 [Acidobacteria bacterium]|nr:hypothetical protein [Acidobacteriota bacterium]